MNTRAKLTRWILGISVAMALTGGMALDAGAGADGAAPGSVELELGYGSERPLELPLPRPDVSADTARAIQELESRRKADGLGRERPRRPDLDHDVTQGIQSRGLERALGR
jgi:hypothetical protein